MKIKITPREEGWDETDWLIANKEACLKFLQENTIGLKRCPRCERKLSIDAFDKCVSRADGHQGYCRKCRRVYQMPQRGSLNEAARAAKIRMVREMFSKPEITGGTLEQIHGWRPACNDQQ